MPPWRKLQKLGKSAMDGAFSPFATGCRVGATRFLQLAPRLARRAASTGCISLVTFFVQAKKVTRPYQSRCVQSANVKTGEKAHQPFKDGGIVSPVSRVRLRKKHV